MRKLAGALCAAICTTLLVAPAADASAKPKKPRKPYVVSLAASGEALAGSVLTLSGKVKGPEAKKAPVHVERSLAGGAWQRIATVRTAKGGGYRAAVTLVNGGPTQFRVVKPKSKKAKAGASPVVSMTVQKWFDLTRSPAMFVGSGYLNQSVTMHGRRFEASAYGNPLVDDAIAMAVYPHQSCSTLEFHSGFLDSDADVVQPADRQVQEVTGAVAGSQPSLDEQFTTAPGELGRRRVGLTGLDVVWVIAGVADPDGETAHPVLGSPRMLCTVDALPSLPDNFTDLLP